jgi:uncharacterized protein
MVATPQTRPRPQTVAQPSPAASAQTHNHYSFDTFFKFDADRGTLVDWNGSQGFLTSEDFILGLIEGLEEEVGEASAAVMYTIGCEWGLRDSMVFEKWFEKEFGKGIRQVNLMFLLETWWWPYTAQGWGRWEVDMSDRQKGFMFINLFDSALARTLGDVGKPVCHLYAGLFAGFFTELVKKQLSCIEIQCYSMGESYCKFLVGGQDRIDAASFWMNEGATAKDITYRLRSEEKG